MASFRTSGLDNLIEDMAEMGESTGELAERMLFAGAEVVKKSWRVAAKKHGLIDTGDMYDSIGYPKKVKKISDVKSVDIYPQGKDRKGIKNAEKAFILHYGTSKKKATHFVDDADDIAGPLVETELLEIYDKWLKTHNMR